MNIFWRDEHPPALRGLDWEQRQEVESAALGKACRHWQVWLPFAIVAVVFPIAVIVTPPFPLRIFIDLLVLAFAVRTAAIPLHAYARYYVTQTEHEPQATRRSEDCTSIESAFADR